MTRTPGVTFLQLGIHNVVFVYDLETMSIVYDLLRNLWESCQKLLHSSDLEITTMFGRMWRQQKWSEVYPYACK